MKRGIVGGLCIAVVAIGCASAADLPMVTKAPIAEPALPSWAGFYLGIEGGGAFGNSNQIDDGPLGFGPSSAGYRVSGGLVGGTAGYNFQAGPWVFGLETDLSWADVTGHANEIPPFTTSTVEMTKEHWLATWRGRLGWTPSNGILLYATGGAALASVEASITTTAPFTLSQTNARWGGTVGAGAEAMLGRGWSAKAEYLYVKLQSSTYFPSPPAGFNVRSDVPFDEHIFRVGVNYHFAP
jgi:outer membrane immunogenic protein